MSTPCGLTGVERRSKLLPPVLAVDDDALFRSLVVDELRGIGLANPVLVAGSVAEAGAVLAQCDPAPVIVLLDLVLPDGTGFDVVRLMRATDRLEKAAIVVLTSSDELEDVDEAHDLGVVSYLQKAVAVDALGDILRRLHLRWAALPPTADGAR